MNKLNVKGAFDFDKYVKSPVVDYEVFQRPLFHGTRKYAIEITPDNLQKFYNACNSILPFVKELIRNKKVEYNIVVSTANSCSAYEYGDFYLTLAFTRAINYSYYIGGELGHNIYNICQEILTKEIELPDKIKAAVDVIFAEYEKFSKSEKIVLAFNGVKFADLYCRGGSKFIDSLDMDEDEKEEIDELYAEEETQISTPDKDFRLKNLNDYDAYIVNVNDFRKGIKIFTKIKDIDEYINLHNLYKRKKWDF